MGIHIGSPPFSAFLLASPGRSVPHWAYGIYWEYIRIYGNTQEGRTGMARKKFTTTLDEDLIQRLKMQAVKERTEVSKILERLVTRYLEAVETHGR